MFNKIKLTIPHYLILMVLALMAADVSAQFSAPPTNHVEATLVAQAPDGVQPGGEVLLGLKLVPSPGWHTYWKNPGDAGLATELQWTLPDGVTAGAMSWPAPRIIRTGALVSYGFENPVMLTIPLAISPSFRLQEASGLRIKLKASWIACRIECIPEERELVVELAQNSSTAGHGPDFDAAAEAQPKRLPGGSTYSIRDNSLYLSVTGLPAALVGRTLAVVPATAGLVNPAENWAQKWDGNTWNSSVKVLSSRAAAVAELSLVIVADDDGAQQSFDLTVTRVEYGEMDTPMSVKLVKEGASDLGGLLAAVLGAMLGGLILNLMPCVFPVLAMKVLSFTSYTGDRRSKRNSGLYYTAGVVLSFVALGALMLLLRSAGAALGWGFQLQSPAVVATLAVLFTAMGLNLAGMFEFGQLVPSKLAAHQAKNPGANAFLSGVLAVAVASPCTAPFMGASLGFALGLPAAQALLIFASIGVGMALPYLGATYTPAVARWLPRPGVWMNTFRRAMAFPMFATVVWLVWVMGQQTGNNGAAALLVLLLALSGVLWAWRLNWVLKVGAATMFAAAIGVFAGIAMNPSLPETRLSPATQWSPELVESELARGVPVFVDFTAAWCVTCQYNKVVLENSLVQQDFKLHGVTVLRADWTNRDPLITEALGKLGRNGVPVYVLYQAGSVPKILSELLTVAEVKATLAQLAK